MCFNIQKVCLKDKLFSKKIKNIFKGLKSLRACLRLCLRNIVFKSKIVFGQKLHFYAFAKNAFWPSLGFLNI
jgi:hypothetical protein